MRRERLGGMYVTKRLACEVQLRGPNLIFDLKNHITKAPGLHVTVGHVIGIINCQGSHIDIILA